MIDSLAPRVFTYENFAERIGEEIGVSSWHRIDRTRTDGFAGVLRAFASPETAAEEPVGSGTAFAHDYLILSLLSKMAEEALPAVADADAGINYGFDWVRFLNPVPIGSRVRARFVLQTAKRGSSGELRLLLGVTIEISGTAEPALVAEWLTLWLLRRTERENNDHSLR